MKPKLWRRPSLSAILPPAPLPFLLAAGLFGITESSASHASMPPSEELKRSVENLLQQHRKGRSLEESFRALQSQLGPRAIPGLLQIAKDPRKDDLDRYAAILASARMGGSPTATHLVPLLQDRMWMVRLATLRALGILKNPIASDAILRGLQDPALVIRSEAIDALTALRPSGAGEALLKTLQDGSNYSAGKAQVIPQKALRALATLQLREAAPRLKPLLSHDQDPALQNLTIETLEKLTGRRLAPGRPLAERLRAWKSERI
jgi:HEAT repeat protein